MTRINPVVACSTGKNARIVAVYKNAHTARLDGYDPSDVRKCTIGERYTHKGYSWSRLGAKNTKALARADAFARTSKLTAKALSKYGI